ncbi:FAD-dependent monooxygenase [Streptomyces sp. N2A]|uniref:FAD-dependent monooxygenase n=1 Tax=Streptomyces sp. N2A TaxID=3073936 RepID=UPI002870A4F7|nr:FAD-dependent monooxygenase [Streptomyces sp. N2A]
MPENPARPMPAHIPVLIAGGGTVGLSAALFLAHHGVPCLVVESEDRPSRHPRATGIGPRTVEFLRETGIAEAVDAVAIDMSAGNLGKISATTLATAELHGPAPSAPALPAADPDGKGRFTPTALRGTCPQNRLDAVLLPAARDRGALVHHATRLLSFEQDADGVTAIVATPPGADGQGGRQVVRADYLLAADGARSQVRAALGIGTSGPGGIGTPMVNILFRADLRPYTKGRSFVSCDITSPEAPGMLLTVDGAEEWIFHTPYDPGPDGSGAHEPNRDAAGPRASGTAPTLDAFTPDHCRALIRTAIGAPGLDVEVLSTLPWRPRAQLADRFRDGRVFLLGDAAHTVPPVGAFGLNTGIADAHNLAWKLSAVLAGHAGPALLDSYEAERRPVAALTLEQSRLRLADPRLHWDRSPQTAAARRAAGVLDPMVVHLGYRYTSGAVLDPQPELPDQDDLARLLDGTPGSRLPHLWLDGDGRRLSTLDLVRSRFTLLTGPGGDAWAAAARDVADRLGIDLAAHPIAPGAAVTDPAGHWPGIAGLAGDGALLVRPDQFVGWRAATLPDDPADALAGALTRLLARDGGPASGGRAR